MNFFFFLSFSFLFLFPFLCLSVCQCVLLLSVYPLTSFPTIDLAFELLDARSYAPRGAVKTETRRQRGGPRNTARGETGETKMRYGPWSQRMYIAAP